MCRVKRVVRIQKEGLTLKPLIRCQVVRGSIPEDRMLPQSCKFATYTQPHTDYLPWNVGKVHTWVCLYVAPSRKSVLTLHK